MVDTRLTGERIRQHFTYNAWKYLLVVVAAIFGWSMLYNMTRYRPPADKKLDVYIAATGADVERMRADMEAALAEALPELEEINFYTINLGGQDDTAGQMQFTTYLAARQGDLYLIPRDKFVTFAKEPAESNALAPLDGYLEDGTIDVQGMDISKGERQGITRGIPAQELYGLLDYGIVPQSLYFIIPAFSGNQENAAELLNLFIEHFHTEKPEWYDDYLRQLQMNLSPQPGGSGGR